jgi:hypothetical protein
MSKLLISERPLQVIPKLAKKIGLNEAIVLQQIHYWLVGNEAKRSQDHYRDGRWWTYNTLEKWKEDFPFWSTRTTQRVLDRLRKMGLVLTGCYNKSSYDKTLWYTIDYNEVDKLSTSSSRVDYDDLDEVSTPIPETTAEITTESLDANASSNTLTQADEPASVASPADARPVMATPVEPKPVKPPTAQQAMVGAIATICQMDVKIKSHVSRIGKIASELVSANYNPDDIAHFATWWIADDWRAKNTPVPTPAKLQEMICQSKQHHASGNGNHAAARASPDHVPTSERPDPPGQVRARELRKAEEARNGVWVREA